MCVYIYVCVIICVYICVYIYNCQISSFKHYVTSQYMTTFQPSAKIYHTLKNVTEHII